MAGFPMLLEPVQQWRILEDVHLVSPWTLKLSNLSFLGSDQMDNFLRDQT